MNIGNVLLIFLLIALNAFFVMVEYGIIASRRARLDILVEGDNPSARIVRKWLEQPAERDRLIAANQVAITTISLALGAVGDNTFQAWLMPYFETAQFPPALAFLDAILPVLPLVLSLFVITGLTVVLGEQVPKVAVLRIPERFSLLAAPVMRVFIAIFKIPVDLMDGATRLVLRLFGIPPSSAHTILFTVEEIKEMVSGPEVEGVIEQPEREMLASVIDFGELVVRQVALPRTEIIAIEADASLDDAVQLAIESTITKLPVFEGSLDTVVGILHVRDLLAAVSSGPVKGRKARELAREALFVPETISVNDLLREFRARRTHIAIVMDEYGGTAGLVTLEDLMEEIVGEVRGTFEPRSQAIQITAEGVTLVDGLVLINEFNEHFGLELNDPNYDTIAGYLLGKLGRIPSKGDVVDDKEHGIQLKVAAMDGLRIAQVEVKHL
jgi:CBS domain containing-hemolysin-like protein